MLLATVAFFPLLFLLALALPERPDVPLTDAMALTLLGTFWIGLAIAHAILLRELPHGDGIVIDVLVGTFLGDTAAYLGGRAFGTRPLAPRDLAEQDGRGARRSASSARPSPSGAPASTRTGSAAGTRCCSASSSGSSRRSATCSSPRSSATRARRTPARCSAPHGGALDRLDAALFSLVAGYYVWLLLL